MRYSHHQVGACHRRTQTSRSNWSSPRRRPVQATDSAIVGDALGHAGLHIAGGALSQGRDLGGAEGRCPRTGVGGSASRRRALDRHGVAKQVDRGVGARALAAALARIRTELPNCPSGVAPRLRTAPAIRISPDSHSRIIARAFNRSPRRFHRLHRVGRSARRLGQPGRRADNAPGGWSSAAPCGIRTLRMSVSVSICARGVRLRTGGCLAGQSATAFAASPCTSGVATARIAGRSPGARSPSTRTGPSRRSS